MKVRLLNSAMMPREGTYKMKRISKEEFCKILAKAHKEGILESTIGYMDNIVLIKKWTGIEVFFNRETTTVEDGDLLLIMKLKYRMRDPHLKGKIQMSEENFEFFLAEYYTT